MTLPVLTIQNIAVDFRVGRGTGWLFAVVGGRELGPFADSATMGWAVKGELDMIQWSKATLRGAASKECA